MFSWISKLRKKKYYMVTYRKVEGKPYDLCKRKYMYREDKYRVDSVDGVLCMRDSIKELYDQGFKIVSIKVTDK